MSSTMCAVEDVVALVDDVAGVWGEHGVGQRAQWVVDRQGLDVVDVEACSGDGAGAQRVNQRVVLDQRAARCVDEDRGGLHRRQISGADDAARRSLST